MKKIFCIALSFVMLVAVMPLTAIANENDFNGPNTTGKAYIKIVDKNNNPTSIVYSCSESSDDLSSQGIRYDISKNTLYLNNCDLPLNDITANQMGSDFKISVSGECSLKRIAVSGSEYNGSLSIIGDGSLYLSKQYADEGGAIILYSDNTPSTLSVSNTVSLYAYSAWGEITIAVYNSTVENPIIMQDSMPEIVHDADCNSYFICDGYSNKYGIVQRSFSAHVKGQDIEYRNGETIYIEQNAPTYISFDLIDSWGKEYDLDINSSALSDAGFTVNGPVRMDDGKTYLEVDAKDLPVGTEGCIELPAYDNEQSNPYETPPVYICTYYMNVQVINPVRAYAQNRDNGVEYESGSTIELAPNDTMMLTFYQNNYPGSFVFDWETESINKTGITVDSTRYEESYLTYCKISTENCPVGTKGTLIFNLKRGEDYDYNNHELDKIAPLYSFEINFEVLSQCEVKGHTPDMENGTVIEQSTCKKEGKIRTVCTTCSEEIEAPLPTIPHGKFEDGTLKEVESNRVEPTCTKAGGYNYAVVCTLCNDAVMGGYVELKPTGHTVSATPKTTRATATADGKIAKVCTKCKQDVSVITVIPKASNVKLSATSYTYNGKVKTPSVTVKDRTGKTLVRNTDYTVSYASGRKNVGQYAVKITFKGKYSGTKTLYFTIKPKATSISSLTAGSKKFTVKWKKQTSQTTGYQIQYSTSSKFSNAKTVTVSKNKTTSKTISKLKAKKKYYVHVRTYKTVNGKKIYSSWSKAKTVTTKK